MPARAPFLDGALSCVLQRSANALIEIGRRAAVRLRFAFRVGHEVRRHRFIAVDVPELRSNDPSPQIGALFAPGVDTVEGEPCPKFNGGHFSEHLARTRIPEFLCQRKKDQPLGTASEFFRSCSRSKPLTRFTAAISGISLVLDPTLIDGISAALNT